MLQVFKSQTDGDEQPVVLVVTRDASTVQAMEHHSVQDKQQPLKLIEHLRDDAIKYLQSGTQLDVIVVELDSVEERELQGLDELMASRPGDTPVVVISPSIDEEMVRLFLRLRVADWLRKPASPHELIDVCRRVIPARDAGAGQQTKCLSFIGAHGGAGVTMLAVCAAILLSQNRKKSVDSSTCLVDLDFSSGMCAEYLDVAPALDLAEIVPDPARLDAQLLGIMLAKYTDSLSLLAMRVNWANSTTSMHRSLPGCWILPPTGLAISSSTCAALAILDRNGDIGIQCLLHRGGINRARTALGTPDDHRNPRTARGYGCAQGDHQQAQQDAVQNRDLQQRGRAGARNGICWLCR